MRVRSSLAAAAALLCCSVPTLADSDATFVIEFKDGTLSPAELRVPAETRIKLILRNTGLTPVEFESIELRKEKVIAPGAESFIVIRRLDPGEYSFFDDFHPGELPARLIVE
jgi:hypothetical protein